MIEKLINEIIDKQIEENVILKEDVNIYRYGYLLVYEIFINIIITIIIAAISNNWIQIIIFLIIYIPLRSFCGGWYADKLWKCTIYSNLIIVFMLVSYKYVIKEVTGIIIFVIFIICSLFIFYMGPVDTKAKPISVEEQKVYKKKLNIILLIHFLIFIVVMLVNSYKIMYVIVYSYATQVVMLVIEKISRKFENKLNK